MIDIYPAVIRLSDREQFDDIFDLTMSSPAPDGTRKVDRCRVAIVDDYLMVAIDSPDGPKMVFREKTSSVQQVGGVVWATTEEGKLAVFEGNDNCDCASRLEGWNPREAVFSEDV